MDQLTTNTEERNWAMYCHLAAFSGLIIPFGNVVAPLILWYLKKDESMLVNREGKKSVNFQSSMYIYLFISAIFALIGLGLFLLFTLAVLNFIFVVLAIIKTVNGEDYHYPLSIKFLN